MRLLLAAAFLAAFFVSEGARDVRAAQPACFPTEKVGEILESKYGEVLRSYGVSHNGRLMLLYANEESGTWTLFAATPDGTSCVLATGENFRAPEVLTGPEA